MRWLTSFRRGGGWVLLLGLVAFSFWVFSTSAESQSNARDRVAFVEVRENLAVIKLIDPVGGARHALREGIHPAWSPDGKRIVFTSTRNSTGDIYVMDADGSSPTRLTDDPSPDVHPAWSPAGDQIAFVSTRDGTSDIYLMNADGSGVRRLTNDAFPDLDPAWSPDGRRITFTSTRKGKTNIYVTGRDGRSDRALTSSGFDSAPAWSPDGRTIAFASTRTDTSEIYLMDADGTNERRITDLDGADDPSWAPGSDALVLSRLLDLIVISPNGSPIRTLSSGTHDVQPAWRPPLSRATAQPEVGVRSEFGDAPAAPGRSPSASVGTTSAGRTTLQVSTPDLAQPNSATEDGSDTADGQVSAPRTRSAFAAAVPRPSELRFDPLALAGSAALAGLVLLFLFPGLLFDNTFSEHYDEIVGWFGRKRKASRAAVSTSWVKIGLAALSISLLSGFLDPGFGLDRASVALYLGLVLFFFAMLLGDVAEMRHLNGRWPRSTSIRVLPAALIITAITVVISRAFGFEPGYFYGAVAALATTAALGRREAGRKSTVGLVILLVVALGAWGLSVPVGHAASAADASMTVLIFDAFLAATFVGGLELALFSVMPLRWFRGRDVFEYSRTWWVAVAAPIAFVFVHMILTQDRGYAGSAVLMLLMFGVFGAISVGFWSYFRLRRVKEPVELES